MAIRTDCRHYSRRTVDADEVVQRCRLGMATEAPFDCPDDCPFFEARAIFEGGWSGPDR